MNVVDVAFFILLLQVPVTFWVTLSYGPKANVLIPWIETHHNSSAVESKAAVFSSPMQIPTLVLSVLLVFTGLRSLKWYKNAEENGLYFDNACDGDTGVPGNSLFWVTVVLFAWIKSFLLMHYIDLFALVLTALMSSVALFVSCRPVDQNTICYRVTGIVAFVSSILPMLALVMEFAYATEMYVLALCVAADGLLIVGHTWDYPACQLQTVVNSRVAYVLLMQPILPLTVLASCEQL